VRGDCRRVISLGEFAATAAGDNPHDACEIKVGGNGDALGSAPARARVDAARIKQRVEQDHRAAHHFI